MSAVRQGTPSRPTLRMLRRRSPTTPEEEQAATATEDVSAADGLPDPAGQAAGEEGDEAAKAEYRKIAERRVRLGLLLAEVGNRNNITVTQDELNQAITREVRRHQGYERQALDFYRQNPEAVASLRAPIFEDKVVDFIVELAKIPGAPGEPARIAGVARAPTLTMR